MRAITQKSIEAFLLRKARKQGNTAITVQGQIARLRLHGNTIAKIEGDELSITDAGWPTVTTKERLNGLPGVNIYQRDFTWYLNGEVWDGRWVTIGNLKKIKR